MLYYQTIDSKTLELLKELQQIPEFSKLNLVGGTSLALQIGHRKSVDIDLFGKFDLDDFQFSIVLRQFKSIKLLNNSQNIKTYLINGIKVDFVNYPYPWLEDHKTTDKIRLSGISDIAAMKLAAITGRGTKKDFVDLFFLFNRFSLEQMIGFYRNKFPDGSEFMVIKSLTYFEDAENEALPVMLKKADWKDVKSKIIYETKKFIIP